MYDERNDFYPFFVPGNRALNVEEYNYRGGRTRAERLGEAPAAHPFRRSLIAWGGPAKTSSGQRKQPMKF